MWPARNDCYVIYSGFEGCEWACEEVNTFTSTSPSADERQLVESLFNRKNGGDDSICKAVCRVARLWKDAALWKRGVDQLAPYYNLHILSDEQKLEAAALFGFDAVKDSFESMLKGRDSIRTKMEFLNTLRSRANSLSPEKDEADKVLTWIALRKQEILETLAELGRDDSGVLIGATKEQGGLPFFKDVILPRVLDKARPDVLRHLASEIHSDAALDGPDKHAIVHALLSAVITDADFLQPFIRVRVLRGQRKPPTFFSYITQFMEECAALGCADLLDTVLRALLAHAAALAQSKAPQRADDFAHETLLPLFAYLVRRGSEDPAGPWENLAELDNLEDEAKELWLSWMAANPERVCRNDIAVLLDAAEVDLTPQSFFEHMFPEIEAMKITAPKTLQAIVDELIAQRQRFVYPPNYTGRNLSSAIASLAKRYTDVVPLPDAPAVVAALEWCTQPHVHVHLRQRVLHRVLRPPALGAAYVSSMFVPLVPALADWGRRRGVLASLGEAFRVMLKAFVDVYLGPPPAAAAGTVRKVESLARWMCACETCMKVRPQLAKQTDKEIKLYLYKEEEQTHLEGMLSAHAAEIATWGAPKYDRFSFSVTKTKDLVALVDWKTKQLTGASMLESISKDPDELKQLLGANHAHVADAMKSIPTASVDIGGVIQKPRVVLQRLSAASSRHVPLPPKRVVIESGSSDDDDDKPPMKRWKS